MGAALLYYLLIKPLSLLPLGVLHGLSYLVYLIVYKLLGYRTKVVHSNLKGSFPEKSESEIKSIMNKFYLHLCDLIVESVKGFSISHKAVKKRMKFKNMDIVDRLHKQGKHMVVAGGHYGNWELFALAIGDATAYSPLALYTPLASDFFNKKFLKSRGKYGLKLLSVKEIRSKLSELMEEQYMVIFGTDQSPRKSQRAYWTKFLNQTTGVQYGAEKIALEFDAAVTFFNIYKVKRGYYEVDCQLICESAKETEYGYITEMHTKLLEAVVRKQPEFWLWSHKRWKHSPPEDVEVLDNFKLSNLPN
ncbi:MAG: lauroyl acyltransferase [Flavobacteriales bacterium]|nr:lauroyl acyltransferase [Flavobacteriales bacterium]|tara:strand:+ start:1569 stop:2480 length:912 start_codon:yes stop_codon:yes gene_type:complete